MTSKKKKIMIKKILVANRGEIAMRIFRTCRVMNISTVAVYTHVDRGALHVRYAEEAYCISESPEDTSYLKPELILSMPARMLDFSESVVFLTRSS